MKRRPVSVTIVGWLFIATGVGALAFHLAGLKVQQMVQSDMVWMLLVELTAIICGVFVLRGRSWARWLAMAWLGFHVVLSAFHSVQQTLVHGALMGVIAYFLFRAEARGYFRAAKTEAG